MSVVVTGASGHIGANLIRFLCSQGLRVRALAYKDKRAFNGIDIDVFPADILDLVSLKYAFSSMEVVYHLAAHISLSNRDAGLMHSINVEGTKNVIKACRFAGIRRLVHFSSIHALASKLKNKLINENVPLAEKYNSTPYDWTKVLAEKLVLEAVSEGLDAVIVNPTAVIGPHDYKLSYMGKFLLSLYQRSLKALVKGGFNWVDARDVAAGARSAELKGKSGERYILGGTWLSLKELAVMVEEITGRRTAQCAFPMWLARAGVPFSVILSRISRKKTLYSGQSLKALRYHQNISLKKALLQLDYQPRPIHETLKDTFEWFHMKGFISDME